MQPSAKNALHDFKVVMPVEKREALGTSGNENLRNLGNVMIGRWAERRHGRSLQDLG